MNKRRLSMMDPGSKGIIAKIDGSGAILRKLAAMGFIPGVSFEVLRRAPLGDPIAIRIKGYNLSLRNEEAFKVLVTSEEIMGN